MKKKVLATIFSSILSLFLAIVLLAACLCVYAGQTICDPVLLLSTAESSGYIPELYEQIEASWDNLLSIAGVAEPDSIMQVLTQEQVREDALAYLQDAYTGTASIETDALAEVLREKVSDYAYSNNIHATPKAELEQNIDNLVAASIEEYKTAIRIPLLPRLLVSVSKIPEYLKLGLQATGIGCIVLLLFLFFLQKKRQNTLYYAALSTATNALLLIAGCWLINEHQLVARIPIDISALRTLLCTYLHTLVDHLERFGYLFLQTTIALLALYLLISGICALVRLLLRKKKAPDKEHISVEETIPSEEIPIEENTTENPTTEENT